MKGIALMLGLVMLAGCASVEDLRNQEPIFSAKTDKTPEAYGACLMEQWRSIGQSPNYAPIPNGIEILIESGVGPTDFVLRALRLTGEPQTFVRLGARGSLGSGKLIERAESCV